MQRVAKDNYKVLVVDDHPIVRTGVISLLELEEKYTICGEANAANEAIGLIEKETPDLAIIDISLKGSDGLELIKSIRAMEYEFPILVMSMHDENLYAERVLRAGGNGYIMKEALSNNLSQALERLLKGKIYVSDNIQERFLQNMSGANKNKAQGVESLSDRELEVYRHIGHGKSTREIAGVLNLSIKTIETYRAHIKDKLNLGNASELVSSATRWVESQE
ncbi:MAG: DNA-binding NarL/FixJ family response regulator [Kiritimatiellia bacterium]|jgi:DNA-binding NarL/FixJ family response regulator